MSLDVMKQALEAIEWALDFIPPESETNCECPLCTAYDALDLAIEQAERQEPVAWNLRYNRYPREGDLLADIHLLRWQEATPPRREWVGLGELDTLLDSSDFFRGARWAEAKLREENT